MIYRLWLAALMVLAMAPLRCAAATFGVTVPAQNTLSNRFLPYATSGTQLGGNSPAWRDSATVLGLGTFTEGYEVLTPGANVTLNWLTHRTKAITLNQNTTFASSNIPSGSTNIQTMVVQVIGDGTSSVTFTGVSWQTVQVPIPTSGAITLYVLRARVSGVVGYAVDFTGGNSALWAMAGGVLVPSPDVDYLSFVSTVVTTGTNVVLNVDTDTAQVAGETLLNVANNSSTQFRVDAVSGYAGAGTKVFTDNGTFQALSSATQDVFSGFYGNGLPTDVPTTSAAVAYDLDPPHILYQWDGSQWY